MRADAVEGCLQVVREEAHRHRARRQVARAAPDPRGWTRITDSPQRRARRQGGRVVLGVVLDYAAAELWRDRDPRPRGGLLPKTRTWLVARRAKPPFLGDDVVLGGGPALLASDGCGSSQTFAASKLVVLISTFGRMVAPRRSKRSASSGRIEVFSIDRPRSCSRRASLNETDDQAAVSP